MPYITGAVFLFLAMAAFYATFYQDFPDLGFTFACMSLPIVYFIYLGTQALLWADDFQLGDASLGGAAFSFFVFIVLALYSREGDVI